MNSKLVLTLMIMFLLSAPCLAQHELSLGQVELHATYRSIGITIPFAGDANGNSTHLLEHRSFGSTEWRQAHPLSRVSNNSFIGSIVLLEPGTVYEVRASFSDPDGVTGSPAAGSISTRDDEMGSPSGTHWYVSPDGEDRNPGVIASDPFETLEHALYTAQPGDAVHLLEGTYHQAAEVSTHGSSSGQAIYVRSEGNDAVFDGSDPDLLFNPGTWSSEGGDIYSVDVTYSPFFVAVEDSQLYSCTSWDDFEGDVHGLEKGYYQNPSDRLYLRFPQLRDRRLWQCSHPYSGRPHRDRWNIFKHQDMGQYFQHLSYGYFRSSRRSRPHICLPEPVLRLRQYAHQYCGRLPRQPGQIQPRLQHSHRTDVLLPQHVVWN